MLTARDMGINFGDAMPLDDDPASWGVPSTHWEEFGGRARSLSDVTQHHVRVGVLGCGNVGAALVGLVAVAGQGDRGPHRACGSRSPGSPCATSRATATSSWRRAC